MNRQSGCWGNAVVESLYRRLKVKLIYAENDQILEEARMGTSEYFEGSYNSKRKHSA